MEDCIKECQAIINPFTTNREYPTRPNPLAFLKKPQTTPTKRSNTETKHDIMKLHKPRKVDKGHSEIFQFNRFAQAKTAKTMPQDPTVTQPTALVAIPIQQTATTVTYAQPVTILATVPTQPVVTASEQPQQLPKFCALCTSTGRQCPNNYLLPIHSEWSDSEEEERDFNKENGEEEKKARNGRLGQYHTNTKRRKRTN